MPRFCTCMASTPPSPRSPTLDSCTMSFCISTSSSALRSTGKARSVMGAGYLASGRRVMLLFVVGGSSDLKRSTITRQRWRGSHRLTERACSRSASADVPDMVPTRPSPSGCNTDALFLVMSDVLAPGSTTGTGVCFATEGRNDEGPHPCHVPGSTPAVGRPGARRSRGHRSLCRDGDPSAGAQRPRDDREPRETGDAGCNRRPHPDQECCRLHHPLLHDPQLGGPPGQDGPALRPGEPDDLTRRDPRVLLPRAGRPCSTPHRPPGGQPNGSALLAK